MSTRIRLESRAAPLGTKLDNDVKRIVEYLKRANRFENSMIVIWSDHGRRYAKNRRLPLIIKFPGEPNIPAENLGWNTQTLDIAPTILETLDVPIPEWMEGRSLLQPIDRHEPIFAISSSGKETGVDPGPEKMIAMGGLVEMGVIVCDRWFNARLESGEFSSGKIHGHTTGCNPRRMLSDDEAECMLAQHLAERGYPKVIGSGYR